MHYNDKELIMGVLFRPYLSNKFKYTSKYKAIPVELINQHKQFIDFTRYYIMYRGPRKGRGYVTLKRDAITADIYEYTIDNIIRKRKDRQRKLFNI